jgi:hypothetical protein
VARLAADLVPAKGTRDTAADGAQEAALAVLAFLLEALVGAVLVLAMALLSLGRVLLVLLPLLGVLLVLLTLLGVLLLLLLASAIVRGGLALAVVVVVVVVAHGGRCWRRCERENGQSGAGSCRAVVIRPISMLLDVASCLYTPKFHVFGLSGWYHLCS